MAYRLPFNGQYPVTQKYGESITSSFHTGIDYGVPSGTPILAANDGKVMVAKTDGSANGGYGKYVIIQHKDGYATLYGHLNSFNVTANQEVTKGQVIGYSGNTGNSTGPHLHWEFRTQWNQNKTHFDPFSGLVTFETTESHVNEPEFESLDNVTNAFIVCPLANVRDKEGHYLGNLVQGTPVVLTGQKTTYNNLPYRECKVTLWIAENDGNQQILGTKIT